MCRHTGVFCCATVSSAAHRLRGMVLFECRDWFPFHPCQVWLLRVPRFSTSYVVACLSKVFPTDRAWLADFSGRWGMRFHRALLA